MVRFLSLKSCLTWVFMTTLILSFFSIAFGGFVLLLHPFLYIYPPLLILFHLKHKLPSLSKSLPGLFLLLMCFLLFKLRSSLSLTVNLPMAFLHATSLNTVRPPSLYSFGHQEPQLPACQLVPIT